MPIDKAAAEAILNRYAETHNIKTFRRDILNSESALRNDLANVGYLVGEDISSDEDNNGSREWTVVKMTGANGEEAIEVDPANYLYHSSERVLTRYAVQAPSSEAFVADLMNRKSDLRRDLKVMGFDRAPTTRQEDIDGNGIPEVIKYDLTRSDDAFGAPGFYLYNGAEIACARESDTLIEDPEKLAELNGNIEKVQEILIPAYQVFQALAPDAPEAAYVAAAQNLRKAKIETGMEERKAVRLMADYTSTHAAEGETPRVIQYYDRVSAKDETIHYPDGDFISF